MTKHTVIREGSTRHDPCGGCGQDDPQKRCIGCMHPFAPPTQAEPAYKDSTPELHIGDSAFESWYSTYSPAHKSDKQRARDAYTAGMGDPLVTAAPASVAGPKKCAPEQEEDGKQ